MLCGIAAVCVGDQALEPGGGGQGLEFGVSGFQAIEVVVDREEYQGDEGGGPCVGDGVLQLFILRGGKAGLLDVTEDITGAIEKGLEFGVEFAVVEFHRSQAAAEYRESGGDVGREFALLLIILQGRQEMGDDGVNLVVGAGRLAGELEDAHVRGLYVKGDRTDIVTYMEYDVAGTASGFRHVCADQSGEVAMNDFDDVAVLEVDILEREVRQAVLVGAGDILEVTHVPVGDHGVALIRASVEKKREPVGLAAEPLDLRECATDEDVMEGQIDRLHPYLAVLGFSHHIGGRKQLEGGLFSAVERVDDLFRLFLKAGGDVVEHVPASDIVLGCGCHYGG